MSKYGVNITKKRDLVEPVERNRRLVICLGYLLRLKENKREHIDLIYGKLYRRYMHELLCGLIQVTSSPMNSQKVILKTFYKIFNIICTYFWSHYSLAVTVF